MMSEQDLFEQMYGRWQGSKELWLGPDDPALESGATADIEPVLQDRFVRLRYAWSFKGQAQEGWLLWPRLDAPGSFGAAWMDSWHMGAEIMDLEGGMAEGEPLRMLGSYAVKPGPDWGWEIVIDHVEEDRLQIFMYNISPAGEKALGVEIRLDRPGA